MFSFKQVKRKVKQLAAPIVTVKQIHNEVYSAHQLLLDESNRVISAAFESEDQQEIANQLSNMGFRRAANVGEPLEALKLRNRINYYQQNYPLQKFIDAETVKKICEKYGLYICATSDFIAEIPLKNQKDIVGFRIKQKDLPTNIIYELTDWPYLFNGSPSSEEEEKQYRKDRGEAQKRFDEISDSEEEVNGTHMKIIATESQIDMRGKKKVGYQIVKDDPIVLQPVDGGYLVVTAWGDEASDEMIVNEKMN
jgi:hypothetical protein